MNEVEYYHGGFPGLDVGDWILSPDDSRTDHALSNAARSLGLPYGTRRDVVYVSPHPEVARVFAAFYPDGSVYRVAIGDVIGVDPDSPGCGVMVDRGRVLEVVRPRVVFAHRKPGSWLSMLTGSCECQRFGDSR